MRNPITDARIKKWLSLRLEKSYFVRFHMMLILLATVSTGMLCSKILLLFGVKSMAYRYGISVVVSYLGFFLFIKLWLLYIGVGSSKEKGKGGYDSDFWLDLDPSVGSGENISETPGPFLGFGGGNSGGGGVEGSFAESGIPVAVPVSSDADVGKSAGVAAKSVLEGTVDVDEGSLGLLAILLLLLCAFSAVAGGVYLIWCAPNILTEAVFQVLLVTGFARKVHRVEESGWETSILKNTWWTFVLVFIFAVGFCIAVHKLMPSAVTMKDVFKSYVVLRSGNSK